jgi:hypothetical protein
MVRVLTDKSDTRLKRFKAGIWAQFDRMNKASLHVEMGRVEPEKRQRG